MKKTLKICTSIFLAMILIVSCICVGTVAPSAVADGECLLLFPNNNSNWLAEVDGKTPRFAACFYTLEGTDAKYQTWVDMTTVIGRAYDHLQFVTVPTAPSGKVWGGVRFCCMNPGTTDNSWSTYRYTTSRLDFKSVSGNCFFLDSGVQGTLNDSGATGHWDTYSGTKNNAGITINDAIPGQTYRAYRLMYIESFDPVSGAYSYKADSAWKTWLKTQSTYVTFNSQDYITWVNNADAAAFAKAAQQYAVNNNITPTDAVTAASTTVTFSLGDKLGYYLVDTTLGTICSLNTTNPQVVIEEKNTAPSVEKFVKENSTGDYGKNNDASIGDRVYFKTVIHAKKGAQNYVLHDHRDEGFVFDTNSIQITDSNSKNLTKDTDYTVNTSCAYDSCTFSIVFTQSYLDTITTDTDIVVTYNATFTSSAKLDGSLNYNNTYLSYGDPVRTYTSNSTDSGNRSRIPLKSDVYSGLKASEISNITVTASGIPDAYSYTMRFLYKTASKDYDSNNAIDAGTSSYPGDDFYARIYCPASNCQKYLALDNDKTNVIARKDTKAKGEDIWHFIKQDDGSYIIENYLASKRLSVSTGETTTGTTTQNNNVFVENQSDTQYNKWDIKFLSDKNGLYLFKPKAKNGFVLDVDINSSNVIIWGKSDDEAKNSGNNTFEIQKLSANDLTVPVTVDTEYKCTINSAAANKDETITGLRIDPFVGFTGNTGTTFSIKKITINLTNGTSRVFNLNTKSGYEQFVDASSITGCITNAFDNIGAFSTASDSTYTQTWQIDLFKYTNYGTANTPLAGAKFTLTKSGDTNPLKFVKMDDYNCRKAQNDSDSSPSTIIETFTSGSINSVRGHKWIKGLDSGTYILHETEAPAGYNKLAEDVTIVISDTGVVKVGDKTGTVLVENKTGAELPMTGGWGTVVFYAVDAAAIIGIIAVIIVRRRRKLATPQR